MIPIKLSLSGFLSYREPVELDFSGFDVACIAGPNGAGKSSLLDAITWCLFGQARKRDDSVINMQSDIADVSLIFNYEGNTYRVQRLKPREKTAILEFHILHDAGSSYNGNQGSWKPLTERSLRETEARIQQMLCLDYETFVNASFFLQGKADQFTQQRPGDRKRILSSILGLEIWESYRQNTAERRKEIEAEIVNIEGRLHEINAELAEEDTRKTRLLELETSLDRLSQLRSSQESALENIRKIAATLAEQNRLVETLARQLDSTQNRLREVEARLAERCRERESFSQILARAGEIDTGFAAWQQARLALERWEQVAVRFREQEKQRQGPLDEINAERARLVQERATLSDQAQEFEAVLGEIADQGARLEEARARIADAQEQLGQRAGLEEALGHARQRLADARAENPILKREMDELKERIDRLNHAEGATCPVCGQPLSPEDRRNLVDELSAQGKYLGDRYRANKSTLAESDQLVQSLEAQIAELSRAEETLRTAGQVEAQISSRLEVLEASQADWQTGGRLRLEEVTAALEEETFASQARQHLAEIDEALKAIGYDAAAHDQVRLAETEGRVFEGQMRDLERAMAAVAPLDREIAEMQVQIEEGRADLERQQREHDTASAVLAAAQAQAPDLYSAESELLNLQEQENRLRLEVGAARQKVLVLDDLKVRRRDLDLQRTQMSYQVGQHKQLERAFSKDGVPALLIEQSLPQIEFKANRILERLSRGTMSVRFVTQAAYKDKRREDLKETLDIQISDSAGVRDYEMFSGGEAFRVNFAIRLALSEVLSQRAGARLQTLVIDEGFGSQDEQGRQRLIEAINMVRQDFAKILVITHIDELKDAFPMRIEVEKTPHGSAVQVI